MYIVDAHLFKCTIGENIMALLISDTPLFEINDSRGNFKFSKKWHTCNVGNLIFGLPQKPTFNINDTFRDYGL